jgi:hypothetical protein
MPLGNAATRPKTRLLRPPSPVFIRLADEGCGSEHDNSRDECCHAGIRQDFIEHSGHCNPRAASPIRAAA